ncbi:MAG: beta-propeller fold lactonase family protein [Mobilitalea sp.]
MEFLLSGYGEYPSQTLALYSFQKGQVDRKWFSSIVNASFVCEYEGYLFTITEEKDYAVIYLMQREDNGYVLLDQKRIDGGYLCHITYSPLNKALFGTCYETGTLFSVQVKDNSFGELLYQEVQSLGNTEQLTRAHCVLLNKAETQLVVVNIALDLVYFYEINEGYLTHRDQIALPEGTGPRHAIYSEDERLLYIITEYSNEIFLYSNETKQLLQRISTLSINFTGSSTCSTLCFSGDHNYLYAANRGADTIALFQVEMDGTLTWLKEFSCGGKHPRHMTISKDANYLMICNQFSGNLMIYEIDQQSGDLKGITATLYFKEPSGICEVGY